MDYWLDEVPSECCSANSVKSLSIWNINKLVIDKGRLSENDLQTLRWIKHNRSESPVWKSLTNNSHQSKRLNNPGLNEDKCAKIPVKIHKPKASTFKNIYKNSLQCIESRDILTKLWDKKYPQTNANRKSEANSDKQIYIFEIDSDDSDDCNFK